MSKKLPSIYKENNTKTINNNKKVFFSEKTNNIEDNKDILNDYIFNTPVIIETYDEIINTKIVSKVNDHILTSNNRVIKLNDIKRISIK